MCLCMYVCMYAHYRVQCRNKVLYIMVVMSSEEQSWRARTLEEDWPHRIGRSALMELVPLLVSTLVCRECYSIQILHSALSPIVSLYLLHSTTH